MAQTPTVEFIFDIASPRSYIAVKRLHAFRGVNIHWVPVVKNEFLKAIAASVNNPLPPLPSCKKILYDKDTLRDANFAGIHFLRDCSVVWETPLHLMESLAALPQDVQGRVVPELFRMYWESNINFDSALEVSTILTKMNVENIESLNQNGKEILMNNFQTAFADGVFDVPGFIVRSGNELARFIGHDRMHYLADHLKLQVSGLRRPLPSRIPPENALKLTMFHDFASPWSYVGYVQATRLCQRYGMTLQLKPILLGALFRVIGTPDVPVFSFPPMVQSYTFGDMNLWLQMYDNMPMRFPDAFPMRTILPLRVSILCPETTTCIYNAAWVDNINIGVESELVEVLNRAGFDGKDLVGRSVETKKQLHENGKLAVSLGVCGVPTFRIGDEDEVFWGQDHLDVVFEKLATESYPTRSHM